jgi:hypothetical protein
MMIKYIPLTREEFLKHETEYPILKYNGPDFSVVIKDMKGELLAEMAILEKMMAEMKRRMDRQMVYGDLLLTRRG